MERSEARALAMLARQAFDERWDPDSEAAARLADSTEAIDAAVEALLDAGDLGMAAMLLGALSSFWQEQGLVDQGRAVTKSALKRVEGNEDWQDWGRVQLVAAELAFRQGDQSEALNLSRHALAASRASRDLVLEADVETNLARIAFRDGDADRMFSHASRVGDLAGEDLRLQSKAVHMLGWAEYSSGDLAAAISRFEQNAAIYAELNDPIGEAMEWANLGSLALESGNTESARRYLAAAMETPGIVDNRYMAPELVAGAGVLVGITGNHQLALELISSAKAMYRNAGLEPDPGDELTPRVEEEALRALGTAGVQAIAQGQAMTHSVAFETARNALAES
ncbi:MAG: hypothetical protein QNJ89_08405 [Acidimicrobiia bacterium]|nr:hypothetical protein [Acidimicrobiia bacterium]